MSIEDILQALDDQCRQECQEIFRRAEDEAKVILDKAQSDADDIRKARVAKVKAEAESESTSILYSARLKSKNTVISAKEQIADKAIARAEEGMRDLRSRDDYAAILEGLISEGLSRISGRVTVHVDATDKELARDVLEKMGIDYSIQNDIHTIGGVIVSDVDGKVLVINTAEERLNRAREKLRMQVSAILFGEDTEIVVGGG